jgi:hypothetical protein
MGLKMRSVLIFILSFCIFTPSSYCEVPFTFRARVQLLDSSAIKNMSKTLEARINYLENRDYLHNLYVQGIPASRDKSAILRSLADLVEINNQINKEVSAQNMLSEKCSVYFSTSSQSYDRIISAARVILSQNSLGIQSPVGYVFRKDDKRDYTAVSADVARATIQFELLSYPLKEQNILFLQDMELPASLIKKDSPLCEIPSRELLQKKFAERLAVLEQLHLFLLGQRGVWDVSTLSNLLVQGAQAEISKIRTDLFRLEATMALTLFAWPYVSVYIGGLEYGGQIKSVLNAANILFTLYLAAKTGYTLYSSEAPPGGTFSTHQAIEQQMQQALHLPESPLELYRLVSNYELQWHLYYLKLSPEKNVASWYPEALKSFGADKDILSSYKEKLQYLKTL